MSLIGTYLAYILFLLITLICYNKDRNLIKHCEYVVLQLQHLALLSEDNSHTSKVDIKPHLLDLHFGGPHQGTSLCMARRLMHYVIFHLIQRFCWYWC